MAKLSSGTRRITTEDYPKENRELVDKLGFTINPFFNSIVDAFNKNLSFTDNFNAQIVELEFNAPVSANQVTIKNPVKGNVGSIIVLRVQNITNSNATLSSAPFVEYSILQNNQLQILNITGLTASNKYLIKLLLLAE
jgi:hypothetical protein